MKVRQWLVGICAAALLLAVGCDRSASTSSDSSDTASQTVSNRLCGKCGHKKGSPECCKDDCEVCAQCGLHSGSLLCCKLGPEYEGEDICLTCGHVADSKECCKDDCAICAECGLHSGSPLCCKLTKSDDAGEEPADDAAEAEDTATDDAATDDAEPAADEGDAS